MGTMLLIYDNQADGGLFAAGFGSWQPQLPLALMQDPRTGRRARSTSLSPDATKWRINLPQTQPLRAISFGPTNFTPGGTYRIKAYVDPAYTVLAHDTAEQNVGTAQVPSLSLLWEDPNFWTGVLPFDDFDNAGAWIIHVFPVPVVAQYFEFFLSDPTNPNGYLEVGRLYIGRTWEPPHNYEESGNRFGFETLTVQQQAIGGTRYYTRRRRLRVFDFTVSLISKDEMFDDVYRVVQFSDLNKQVFIIPDPDDLVQMQKRSFLGNLTELPSWQLLNTAVPGDLLATTAFRITEAI